MSHGLQIGFVRIQTDRSCKLPSMHEFEQEPNMPAAHVAMLTGARGPTRSCLTACAASTQAVGEAAMLDPIMALAGRQS